MSDTKPMREVWAGVLALPLVWMVSGCTIWHATTPPGRCAVFCNIKDVTRGAPACATAEEIAGGVNMNVAHQQAAWSGRFPTYIGLDYSDAATTECGPGRPKAVYFRCPFPQGCQVCTNCGAPVPGERDVADLTEWCVSYCNRRGFGGTTSDTSCRAITQVSQHATPRGTASSFFVDACTAAGIARSNWMDPRRVAPTPTPPPTATPTPTVTPTPIPPPTVSALLWIEPVQATVEGTTLRKTGGTPNNWDAGAFSQQTLTAGDGFVDVRAGNVDQGRIIGLGPLERPAGYPSFGAITYAIYLRPEQGTDPPLLRVIENGVTRMDAPRTAYGASDVVRIVVVAGRVEYQKGGITFYTSSVPVTYGLRAYASLYTPGAAIIDARVGF